MVQNAPDTFYSVSVTVPPEEAEAFEEALGEEALSTSLVEVAEGRAWTVSALFESPPEPGPINGRLAALSAALGRSETPDCQLAEVPPEDWVYNSLADFPPLRVGRYWIAGNHVEAAPPAGTLPLRVDASVAFGTGHHGSTAGCLEALDRLRKHLRPRSCLDLGCGTAILAMAAARSFPSLYAQSGAVIASDIDPEAVAIARATVHTNRLAKAVTCCRAASTHDRRIRATGPYDLVFANILAGPLKKMAPQIAAQIAPGGYVLLSGILGRQGRRVLARYRHHGFVLRDWISRDQWATLVLKKIRDHQGRESAIAPFQSAW